MSPLDRTNYSNLENSCFPISSLDMWCSHSNNISTIIPGYVILANVFCTLCLDILVMRLTDAWGPLPSILLYISYPHTTNISPSYILAIATY